MVEIEATTDVLGYVVVLRGRRRAWRPGARAAVFGVH